MGVRFIGMGPARTNVLRREKMLFFGGSTLMFALMVIGALLVYSNTVVQAREDVIVEPALDSELAFGTVTLIAPTTQVPKGTKLTTAYLREVHWPRDQVPEGAARRFEDIEGMFSLSALTANQPILRAEVAINPPSFGIGELLPPGHRAVTIQVDAVTGIEGWATPGAHVDVLLTYLDPNESVYKTRIAVEDAVVLSYGGKAQKVDHPELDRPNVSSTVTLAVPFEDSLRMQTASAIGRITLALRSSNDLASAGKTEFSANDWDEHKPVKKAEPNKFVSNGFASYVDKSGSEREFILGQDNKWWQNSTHDE